MSNHQPQGSIILKILIIIAAIVLIAVILIPGEIWENEEKIKDITLTDIESLYEAQRYYYNLNQEYTSDMNVLLTSIHNDSTLKVKKQVVDYTIKLRKAIDNFFEQPIINSLIKITLSNRKWPIKKDFLFYFPRPPCHLLLFQPGRSFNAGPWRLFSAAFDFSR